MKPTQERIDKLASEYVAHFPLGSAIYALASAHLELRAENELLKRQYAEMRKLAGKITSDAVAFEARHKREREELVK